MLEVCPTIADGPVSIKVNPLSMGDREDPARLVFTAKEGEGIATSLIDLGHRFRLIINKVDCKRQKTNARASSSDGILDTKTRSL